MTTSSSNAASAQASSTSTTATSSHALLELLLSERVYLAHLHILINIYLFHLPRFPSLDLSPLEIRTLARNAAQLRKFHIAFLALLEDAVGLEEGTSVEAEMLVGGLEDRVRSVCALFSYVGGSAAHSSHPISPSGTSGSVSAADSSPDDTLSSRPSSSSASSQLTRSQSSSTSYSLSPSNSNYHTKPALQNLSSFIQVYASFCASHSDAVDILRFRTKTTPDAWAAYERFCAMLVDEREVMEARKREARRLGSELKTGNAAMSASNDGSTLRGGRTRIRPRSVAITDANASSSKIRSRLTFQDYLIEPIQRICRYPLLLQALAPRARSLVNGSMQGFPPYSPVSVVDYSNAHDPVSSAKVLAMISGSETVSYAVGAMRDVARAVDEERRKREAETKWRCLRRRMKLRWGADSSESKNATRPSSRTRSRSLSRFADGARLEVERSSERDKITRRHREKGELLLAGGLAARITRSAVPLSKLHYRSRSWSIPLPVDSDVTESGDTAVEERLNPGRQEEEFEYLAAFLTKDPSPSTISPGLRPPDDRSHLPEIKLILARVQHQPASSSTSGSLPGPVPTTNVPSSTKSHLHSSHPKLGDEDWVYDSVTTLSLVTENRFEIIEFDDGSIHLMARGSSGVGEVKDLEDVLGRRTTSLSPSRSKSKKKFHIDPEEEEEEEDIEMKPVTTIPPNPLLGVELNLKETLDDKQSQPSKTYSEMETVVTEVILRMSCSAEKDIWVRELRRVGMSVRSARGSTNSLSGRANSAAARTSSATSIANSTAPQRAKTDPLPSKSKSELSQRTGSRLVRNLSIIKTSATSSAGVPSLISSTHDPSSSLSFRARSSPAVGMLSPPAAFPSSTLELRHSRASSTTSMSTSPTSASTKLSINMSLVDAGLADIASDELMQKRFKARLNGEMLFPSLENFASLTYNSGAPSAWEDKGMDGSKLARSRSLRSVISLSHSITQSVSNVSRSLTRNGSSNSGYASSRSGRSIQTRQSSAPTSVPSSPTKGIFPPPLPPVPKVAINLEVVPNGTSTFSIEEPVVPPSRIVPTSQTLPPVPPKSQPDSDKGLPKRPNAIPFAENMRLSIRRKSGRPSRTIPAGHIPIEFIVTDSEAHDIKASSVSRIKSIMKSRNELPSFLSFSRFNGKESEPVEQLASENVSSELRTPLSRPPPIKKDDSLSKDVTQPERTPSHHPITSTRSLQEEMEPPSDETSTPSLLSRQRHSFIMPSPVPPSASNPTLNKRLRFFRYMNPLAVVESASTP